LIKGLESQQKALNNQAIKIGDAIVKAIKSKLKIHSPSRVFRDEVGKFIPLGIISGIDSQLGALKNSSKQMIDAVSPDLSSISSNLSQDMSGSLLSARIDALGDRMSDMSVNIDGKLAGNILRPHISEAEAKEQRRQFKAKGLNYNI
ncbi:hypothetical protein HB935_14960, partial [Listeria welshimeri]|nr:hypothetical protein [Listeria welshimeri]